MRHGRSKGEIPQVGTRRKELLFLQRRLSENLRGPRRGTQKPEEKGFHRPRRSACVGRSSGRIFSRARDGRDNNNMGAHTGASVVYVGRLAFYSRNAGAVHRRVEFL